MTVLTVLRIKTTKRQLNKNIRYVQLKKMIRRNRALLPKVRQKHQSNHFHSKSNDCNLPNIHINFT